VAAAAPIEKTLRQAKKAGQLKADDDIGLIEEAIALGIIGEADRETLEAARQLRNLIIQVNAFDGLSERETRKNSNGDKSSLLHRLGVA
jgi:acyl-CoA dehydrogenase